MNRYSNINTYGYSTTPGANSYARATNTSSTYGMTEANRRAYGEAAIDRERKTIIYGDRIFIRITAHGTTLLELMTNRVSNYSELLGELRGKTGTFRGLAMIYIRNHSRGWSRETPFMIYEPKRPANHTQNRNTNQTAADHSGHSAQPRRMLFPWETH